MCPSFVKGTPVLRAISRVALAAILGVLMPVALAVPILAASPSVQVAVSASPSPNVSPGKAVLFIVDYTQGRVLYSAFATYHAYLEFPVLLALLFGRAGRATGMPAR